MAAQVRRTGNLSAFLNRRVLLGALLCVLALTFALALDSSLAGCAAADGEGETSHVSTTADNAADQTPEADPDAAGVPEDANAADQAAATSARQAVTPSQAGALQVIGSQLCDAKGNPVQLRGVSTHGLAWFPQYVNAEFFNELRQTWGANVVRLALYTAESGGYTTDGDQDALYQLVCEGIDDATAADLYVIADWHVLSDQNPLAHVDEAAAFFGDLSARYADANNVIYEICNEPNGATTWDNIVEYANQIIPVIRANDSDAIIIVGTPEWSQRVDAAAAAPLADDNVLYALHFYAATHGQDLRDRMKAAVDAGLPVFVSEFGICDASGNGAIDYASADAWVKLMDELNVSYVCWNVSNKDEASALFVPQCAKTSGFDEADLSEEGQWLMAVLRGEQPGGDDVTSVDTSPGTSANTSADPADPAAIDAAAAAEEFGSDIVGATGSLQYCVKLRQTWESDGKTSYLYDMEVINAGSTTVYSWNVEVALPDASLQTITITDSWNATFATKNGWLQVSNVDFNGRLAPGETASDIGFIAQW